ncbi:MAG: cyclic pyranopterin monophosphate synthase MoaC [Methanocalculaceae archaeon]|jgi:cyclic pyranopterin phosphate synthase|nr:cyclic pyranopterin monophosphate synthase MoaC [Methanocalculaceae archaeon]
MPTFTHLNEKNEVHMVDVTPKPDVPREATARGKIHLRPETLKTIAEGKVVKGNVLATAQVAGTLAVKQTWALIPMCHPIPVGAVTVSFVQTDEYIEVSCRVKTFGKTGIEMEALTGASVALLTIWDMVKSAEKDADGQYPVTRIEDIHVVEKIKGTAE